MNLWGTYRGSNILNYVWRACVFSMTIAAVILSASPLASAQANQDQPDTINLVRGHVLNSVTKAPVSRALVIADGNQYATFTDDQGRFEFHIHELSQPNNVPQAGMMIMERSLTARKPGYLDAQRMATAMFLPGSANSESKDLALYLVPESRIVGHVEIPGSEGDVRIICQLYRRNVADGNEKWSPAGTFRTWSNGEFRFSDLEAGTYKLITQEQMDRDSMIPVPGRPLFGYPPMYYPNTTDFSAATPILVKPGETVELNLTVARHPYYPVRIAVTNAPDIRRINLTVSPMGHHGPGWSLGYNPMDGSIEGLLPDGNYTVELESFGDNPSAGIVNFAVRGRPLQGATLNVVPLAPIPVNVHEEFQSNQNGPRNEFHSSSDFQVRLTPLEELASSPDHFAQPLQGSEDHALIFKDVPPGRYRIHVISAGGYASSIDYGGVDLLKQPLVVGLGGAGPPIEITLRNDGAEINGTVQQSANTESDTTQQNGSTAPRYVYLLSLETLPGQTWASTTWNGSSFHFEQIPPGDYLLLAFEAEQVDLHPNNADKLEALESKGQIIHLEVGQKANVSLKLIPENDSQ
jgi:hypothetical protein